MLNGKHFWYGLGLGLIAASLYLGAAGTGTASESKGNALTDPSALYQSETNDTLEQLFETEQETGLQDWSEDMVREKAEEYGFIVMTKEEAERIELERQQAEQNSAEADVIYVIPILAGMHLGHVTNMLLEAGLIDDADQFTQMMVQEKLQYSVQPGIFRIREGTEIEEIARIITQDAVVASSL